MMHLGTMMHQDVRRKQKTSKVSKPPISTEKKLFILQFSRKILVGANYAGISTF